MSYASDHGIPDDEDAHKSGEDNQDGHNRKGYHRHTPQQIHEMEQFFKQCPKPKKPQRVQLARDLGLDPKQVKYWFQNKRMQNEAHTKRARNAHLKLENEKLGDENIKFKAALTNACCLTCAKSQATSNDSLDRHQLRVENIWLKEKVARLTDLMAKYAGKKYANNNVGSSSVGPSSSANLEAMIASREWQQNFTKETVVGEELIRSLSGQTIIDKTTATMLVNSATEELIRMVEIEYPLWIPIIDDKSYLLNQGAYYDMFPGGVWQKLAGFNVEASKGNDIVKMNHANLAKIFMDTDKWLAVIANIVSRALVVEVITEGSEFGSCNGTLLMMTAEYQALTPTIPTRETYF